MAVSVGDKLGPYEIVAPIGAGGMGEVWKARDTRLNRLVAIKRLKGEHGRRFAREARAIAALNHPHICQIYDVGPDYLVMEYIEGEALRGPMAPEEAARIALQIAHALETSHARGILHRDLKPANVLLTNSGAKLLDFGLAKFQQVGPDDETAHTIEGTIIGTAPYMSPEQAQGRAVDERSDVFSFGAVFYEMLSGRRAFAGGSLAEVLNAVICGTPAPLDSPLAAIVNRCLAKAPAQRFAGMSEIRAALESVLTGKPAEELPSIAVLPFINMSGDKEQQYFSDGLAEEILNLLAHISELKVTARTSSFAFRGKEQDITAIAATLKVRTVLEGSVRRAGNRIRITAQLIDAADGYHIWSERYDREMNDVFAIQDEIAAAIAQALELKLTAKHDGAARHQPNLPAYEAYLKGRHEVFRFSTESRAQAVEYFRQAAALDPSWAEPHAQIGYCHLAAGILSMQPMLRMAPEVRTAAQQALERSPSDPMAHAVLGTLAALVDYEWAEAAEQFRLARAAGPGLPYVQRAWPLFYLSTVGRYEEAIRELDKLVAQDPLDPIMRRTRGYVCMNNGMWERALVDSREAVALGESSALPHLYMAMCAFYMRNLAEARQHAEEAYRISPQLAFSVGVLAGILTQCGALEDATRLLQYGADEPVRMFFYHHLCSQTEAAIDCYAKLIEQRNPIAPMIAFTYKCRPMRKSPRWPTMAKMMNLPETSPAQSGATAGTELPLHE